MLSSYVVMYSKKTTLTYPLLTLHFNAKVHVCGTFLFRYCLAGLFRVSSTVLSLKRASYCGVMVLVVVDNSVDGKYILILVAKFNGSFAQICNVFQNLQSRRHIRVTVRVAHEQTRHFFHFHFIQYTVGCLPRNFSF